MAKPEEERTTPQYYIDIWNTILDDSWMHPVHWGKPRKGKTSSTFWAGYDVYEDWDHVLQSTVFILPGLLQKMQKGVPHTIQTLNGLHHRVPFILGDDWAANNNKATTQYLQTWDIFKGAFDTLGTKMAVFAITLNNPSGITDQLQAKYTHEIFVEHRGIAKYDTSDWKQNYKSWQAMQSKVWLQTYKFKEVPKDVYKEYDELRKNLVDELFQKMLDSMIENEGMRTFKRLNTEDVDFIEIMVTKGMVSNDWINKSENEKYKEVLTRCKSRSIVIPVRRNSSYWYELTDFGYELYKLIQLKRSEGVFAPNVFDIPPTTEDGEQ